MIILLIWLFVLLAVLLLYLRQTYTKLSKHGVKHFKVVPFFGHMLRIALRRETLSDEMERSYYAFPEERFYGRYEFFTSMLMIRDVDLIKKITIKDFEHFLDHRRIADETIEPLFARNLLQLKGQEWKDMRSTLSPAFTSSKIKLMVPFMEEIGEQMIRALRKRIQDSESGSIDVDCKDLTTRYANDVIASCAFGLKVDSFADEDNTFYKMGKTAATFKLKQILLFFAVSAWPAIAKRLKLKLFSNETREFFINLVISTMKDREARNLLRPDMIHLLMEAKKGHLSHDDNEGNETHKDTGFATVEESSVGKKKTDRVWCDNDLIAQAVVFFIAGFDTISTAMSFALHELAMHPEVQERLLEEIKENNAKTGGELNFNSIQNMTYLDMVISETLRLWPPGVALNRLCVKDYNVGKPNSKSTQDYIVRKGEIIMIPVWCFHHDPKYFPNPMKFDPERFSEENKPKINPFTYMPFGLGPRNCIGSRFALCELKMLLYQIILHMEISPSEKTCLPAKLSTESFNPRLEGGHWLRFKVRK